MKKGNHDNNGLRKVQRELKGKGGGEGKGKGSGDAPTRADADEEETVEVIIDAVIDNKAGDVGGDDITPDAMQTCNPTPVDVSTKMHYLIHLLLPGSISMHICIVSSFSFPRLFPYNRSPLARPCASISTLRTLPRETVMSLFYVRRSQILP